MKIKLIPLLLLISACLSLAGCKSKDSCEVAFITDGGTVEDARYNESCYAGLVKFWPSLIKVGPSSCSA